MGTYYQRSTVAASPVWTLTGTNYDLDPATASAATVDVTVAASAANAVGAVFSTYENVPGSVDYNGSYAMQVDVTAAGASVTYGLRLARYVSTNSNFLLTGSAVSFSGTGLKSHSGTASGITSSATDRLGAEVRVSSSNMMTAETLTLNVNTTDSYVEVPWTVGAPPAATYYESRRIKTVLQAVNRASTY